MNGVTEPKKVTKWIIFMVIIFVLLLTALYFFLISPLKKEVKQAKDQLETEEQLLYILEEKEGELAENEADIATNVERLPNGPNIEYYVLQLEEIASKTGVEISDYNFSINDEMANIEGQAAMNDEAAAMDEQVNNEEGIHTTENEAESSSVQEVNTSITVNSNTYESLYSFLVELERLQRITYVSSYSIFNDDAGENDASFLVNLQLRTFYYPREVDEDSYEGNADFVKPSGKENPFKK